MNIKLLFTIIITCCILFNYNFSFATQKKLNIKSDINSIWECPAGEFNTMKFILYNSGTFLFNDLNTKTKSKGKDKEDCCKRDEAIEFLSINL